MKKFKTQNLVTLRDSRQKILGDFVIYMQIEEISFNSNMVVTKGFYYYEKVTTYEIPQEPIEVDGQLEEVEPLIGENVEVILLDRFQQSFMWSQIEEVEMILQPIEHVNLKQALEQRVVEFTMIQMQIESGQNYGTVYSDWIIAE